ncbi:MAG: DAK2 domain-containing protein [Chloroflexota bacterium]|nr:DAK2 domain-containing protein [Dehalococcoidia bacterium]MDW8254114.1 DAK2 domain-containing protein [Chloroflexota bacterium]
MAERIGNRSVHSIDGQGLKAILAGGAAWLERQAAVINALNVFPVPDGDTGTNMSLTMRSTLGAVANSPEHHVGQIAAAMARGALMGARGNSGVILSQIIRGFAKAVEDEPMLDGAVLAKALAGATRTAYAGIAKPVEGTMLTVIRRAAEEAQSAAERTSDVEQVLAAATEAARIAVAETPNQLAVLKEAGVVDAGGQGVYVLLDGALRTLRGEQVPEVSGDLATVTVEALSGEQAYGYCTQFLIQGQNLDMAQLQRELEALGDSLIVVGDETVVRVHLHTFDPGAALQIGTRAGILRQVSVENMQLQHEDWKQTHLAALKPAPVAGLSVVAVAAGEGFRELFRSLGAAQVITGGQTMNPSAQDLLEAIEATPTTDVIILPNNENIFLTAKQAASMTQRRVGIVPTRTLAQGVGAMLAIRVGEQFETNLEAMTAAAEAIDTGEITVAIRDATFDTITIRNGQAIGLLNGRVAAVGETLEEAFWSLLEKMRLESAEVVTLYTGAEVSTEAGEKLAAQIRERYPHLQVEVVEGGQPFYHYIIARE